MPDPRRSTRLLLALVGLVCLLVVGLAVATVRAREQSPALAEAPPDGLTAALPVWLPLALTGADRGGMVAPPPLPTQPTGTATSTVIATASPPTTPSSTETPKIALPTLACPWPTDPLPTPTPRPTPTGAPLGDSEEPPPARLEIGDQTHLSGVGTYCWPVSGMCVDYFAIVTPREPIRVTSVLAGRLLLSPAPPPERLEMMVHPVTPDEDRAQPGLGVSIWEPRQPGSHYPLLPQREQEIRIAREPGLYVLWIYAAWPSLWAEVEYGFLVEVVP